MADLISYTLARRLSWPYEGFQTSIINCSGSSRINEFQWSRLTVLTFIIDGVEPSAHEEYRSQLAPVHEVTRLLAAGSAEDSSARIGSRTGSDFTKRHATRKFGTRVHTLPLELMRSSRIPCTTSASNIRPFHWSAFYCLTSMTSDNLLFAV